MKSNEQARFEMQSFLKALDSYAESFAQNPGISFEEHRSRVESVPQVTLEASAAPKRKAASSAGA